MNKFFILITVLIFFTSCKHESLIEDKAILKDCTPGEIGFVNDILPIMQTSCAVSGCHNAGSATHGVILDSYKNIITTGEVIAGNANLSELYEVLNETGNDMMPPANSGFVLTQTQKDNLKDWINQGAKNIECNPIDTVVESCDSVNVSFANQVNPLLNQYCINCHSAGNNTGVDLDSYAGVLVSANSGSLFGSINHDTGFDAMPQGSPKWNICDISIVKNWIAEGAQNN